MVLCFGSLLIFDVFSNLPELLLSLLTASSFPLLCCTPTAKWEARVRIIGCYISFLLCNLITTKRTSDVKYRMWKWSEKGKRSDRQSRHSRRVNLLSLSSRESRDAFRSLWSEQLTVQFSMTSNSISYSFSKFLPSSETIFFAEYRRRDCRPSLFTLFTQHNSLRQECLFILFLWLSLLLSSFERRIPRVYFSAVLLLLLLFFFLRKKSTEENWSCQMESRKKRNRNNESSFIQSQSTFSLRCLFSISHDNSPLESSWIPRLQEWLKWKIGRGCSFFLCYSSFTSDVWLRKRGR